jgi:hypothetical protein
VELPTYTNIWKIEKRLYKLYDFRLPMPLPVGQVAAFLAIAVPYAFILAVAGMPFSHTWLWLYVLPPGVLAWLVTRPVLEGKRLPELALSQLRYLNEPGTWCRMAPLAEKDQIAVSATVWRRPPAAASSLAPAAGLAPAARDVAVTAASQPRALAPEAAAGWPASARGPSAARRAPLARGPAVTRGAAPLRQQAVARDAPVREPAVAREPARAPDATPAADFAPGCEPGAASRPPAGPAGTGATDAGAAGVTLRPAWPAHPAIGPHAGLGPAARPVPPPGPPAQAGPPGPETAAGPEDAGHGQPAARPLLTVRADAAAAGHLNVVERALRAPRADGWRESVVVVPGGHRPGKPDQVQRDQARARLPLAGPARIVVLGCTGGAGQTIVTLLTGQVLTSLRAEPVAVLDLAAGPGSLTDRAREIPRLLPGRRGSAAAGQDRQASPARERGLQVVTADGQTGETEDAGRLIDAVVARYQLTLADPEPRHVPRALQAADQLLLVAPASADAPGALAMTLEWLEAHGHQQLARSAVAVLNGLSEQTGSHVDKAAAVAAGRCRAVVRVPWDAGLATPGPLAMPTVQAFTALAGVLIAALAEQSRAGRAGR